MADTPNPPDPPPKFNTEDKGWNRADYEAAYRSQKNLASMRLDRIYELEERLSMASQEITDLKAQVETANELVTEHIESERELEQQLESLADNEERLTEAVNVAVGMYRKTVVAMVRMHGGQFSIPEKHLVGDLKDAPEVEVSINARDRTIVYQVKGDCPPPGKWEPTPGGWQPPPPTHFGAKGWVSPPPTMRYQPLITKEDAERIQKELEEFQKRTPFPGSRKNKS